jgi:hypothetical protein
LANKLSHPAKALMFDEILHVLSRAPLELFYAALVSSYWVHMFMPGGCIPAAALLVFFPLSLLRGVAAWFNLGLDAKRRVMPDFQDGPGTIWVCNWWIQGFLFFFFTRTQLQHFIEYHGPSDSFTSEVEGAKSNRKSTSVKGGYSQEYADEVMNSVFKAVYDRVDTGDDGLTAFLKSKDLDWITANFKDIFLHGTYGSTMKLVINSMIDKAVTEFLKLEPKALEPAYKPIVGSLIPHQETIPSVLRRLGPKLFQVLKSWVLVKEQREHLRQTVFSRWAESLKTEGIPFIPHEQEMLLRSWVQDWVSIEAESAFLFGLRGMIIAHPALKIEERIPPSRIARTESQGALRIGSKVQVRDDLLPATTARGRRFPPHFLPGKVVKTYPDDKCVDIEYDTTILPVLGHPEQSDVCLMAFAQPSSKKHEIHVVVSDLAIDLKFEDSEMLQLFIDWGKSDVSDENAPRFRVNVDIEKLTGIAQKACVRIGTQGFVYGVRQHVVWLENLQLHDGNMKWTFDVEIKEEGISLTTITDEEWTNASIGELEFPHMASQTSFDPLVNLVTGLFARTIKETIPSLLVRGLGKLNHRTVFRWELLHSIFKQKLKEAIASGNKRKHEPPRPSLQTPLEFKGWAQLQEEQASSGFIRLMAQPGPWQTVWLEIREQHIVWYDSRGVVDEHGEECVPVGKKTIVGGCILPPKRGSKVGIGFPGGEKLWISCRDNYVKGLRRALEASVSLHHSQSAPL